MDLAHVEASDTAGASLVTESFEWLRIRVQGEIQLRQTVPDGNLLYVKFSVDPGNQSATTNTLDPSKLKALCEEVHLLLASGSLHLMRLELLVEVFLLDPHDQRQQECVGCNRVVVQQYLDEIQTPKEITLFSKRGRGRAGSIQGGLSIERYSGAMPTQSIAFISTPACRVFYVAVLCCDGLDDSTEAVVSVQLVQDDTARYTSDVAAVQTGDNDRHVWNQILEFTQESGDMAPVIIIKLLDDSSAPSKIVGEVTVDLFKMANDGKTCVWLPLEMTSGVSTRVQLCIACWRSKGTRPDDSTSLLDDQSNNINTVSGNVLATDSSGHAIPLGSTLTIQIDSLCQPNEAVQGQISSLSHNTQTDQALLVCAQIVPCGLVSRVQISSNCILVDANHCKNQGSGACIRGFSTSLQVELKPEIVQACQLLNGNLMLQLEIRPSRSRSWSLSTCFSLTSCFRDHSTECSITAPCSDQDDNSSGFARLTLCRGPNYLLSNRNDSSIITKKRLQSDSLVSVAVQTINVPPSVFNVTSTDGDKQFYTEIWSSRLGRKRAQQSTSFAQSAVSLIEVKAEEAGFQVADIYSEVFFLEVRASRPHERNQLIGWCFFTIPIDELRNKTPGDDKLNSCASLKLRLHRLPQRITSRPQSHEAVLSECGEVLVNIRVEECEMTQAKPLSMASSLLSDVAYDLSPTSDCRGKLELQLIDAQNCDLLSAGDTIQVGLRIASAKWRAKSSAGPIKQNERRIRQIAWDESFETDLYWSSRDRAAPTLEVTLLQIQLAKPVQLVKLIQKKSKDNPTRSSVLIGGCDLDLCALLTHSRSWVRASISVVLSNELSPNQSPRTPSVVSVALKLRWSPVNKGSDSSSQIERQIGSDIPPPFHVDGDISVHVLHCSGNFLRREDSISTYYVAISCDAQSVETRAAASDNGRASWNEQLLLEINSAASPIICVQLYKKKTSSLSLAGNSAECTDELVGFLSIPFFPFIVESQHLLSLSLPIVSRSEEAGQATFKKCGVMALEIQYFARVQSNDNLKFGKDMELVLHQVREMRGSDGIIGDMCKHIRFQVLLACNSTNESETIANETGWQCIPRSGSSIVNEAVLLNRSVLNRIKQDRSLWVIILYVCDISSKRIGQIHIPLRRDWEQQIDRKARAWYPIYTQHPSESVPRPSGSTIELSFQNATLAKTSTANGGLVRRVYFACKQVIVHSRHDPSPLNCEAKAWIEIGLEKFTATTMYKSTTKQLSSGGHWSWPNESIATDFPNDCDDQERILVRFVCQQLSLSLECPLTLSVIVEDESFVPVDRWLTLDSVPSPNHDDTNLFKAHMEVQMLYVPAQSGIFLVQLNELRPLSASIYTFLLIERAFIKCVLQGKMYATPLCDLGSLFSDNTEWELQKLLSMPFDSLSDCDPQRFQLSLEWIGISRTGDEIGLGELSIDLLASLAKSNSRVRWYTLLDKRNNSEPTAAISVSIDFRPGQELSSSTQTFDEKFTRPMVRSERQTLLSQIMTVWKKLFYSLDTNQNGRIDLAEFKLLFVHHLNDFALTTDGKKLLTILFGNEWLQESDSRIQPLEIPTDRELELLFAEIDTNEDHEVEWKEFLQFLRLRIERCHPIIEQRTSELAKEHTPILSVPANQNREARRKRREDTNIASAHTSLVDMTKGALSAPSSSSYELIPPSTLKRLNPSQSQSPVHVKRGSSELQTQVKSLQTLLGLEKKKYDQLHQNWMELQRKHRQLELQQQKRTIQDQTREQWVKQTTEHQQQILKERESARQKCHVASIVLQSNLRSRLEQKRFQALKLNRASAAITIQCFTRVHFARKELGALQIAHEKQKRLINATVRVQRFLRSQFQRREREMMVQARDLSAQIIQKHSRRIVETKRWNLKRSAALTLQCRFRQRLAWRRRNDLSLATKRMQRVVQGWICRWKWNRIRKSTNRLKKWWKRMKMLWWEHIEQLDAASCIQATWRGRKQRLRYEQMRTTLLMELETSMKRGSTARFILARWRCLRVLRLRSKSEAKGTENTTIGYPTKKNATEMVGDSSAANGDSCGNPSAFDVEILDEMSDGRVISPLHLLKNDNAEKSAGSEDVVNVLSEIVEMIESTFGEFEPAQVLNAPRKIPVEVFTAIELEQTLNNSEHGDDLESESNSDESGEHGAGCVSMTALCKNEEGDDSALIVSRDPIPPTTNTVLIATATDEIMENSDAEHCTRNDDKMIDERLF